VYLGIQLLSNEMKQLTERNSQEKDNHVGVEEITEKLGGMLKDIEESCSISINILNDLLLIDKIEEGNLVLQIASVNAKDFIEPCIMNFKIQVAASK
jgi:signal transduction histidine kinase